MPCFRHTSPADSPAACSFSTLMICSSVNLLLRMSVSSEERTLPKIGGIYGEQVIQEMSLLSRPRLGHFDTPHRHGLPRSTPSYGLPTRPTNPNDRNAPRPTAFCSYVARETSSSA